jgi:hypothetical protein
MAPTNAISFPAASAAEIAEAVVAFSYSTII